MELVLVPNCCFYWPFRGGSFAAVLFFFSVFAVVSLSLVVVCTSRLLSVPSEGCVS